MSSLLWVFSIVAPIAHAFDYPAAGRTSSINPLADRRGVDTAGLTPLDDTGARGSATPVDQYGTFNDGSMFSAGKLAAATAATTGRSTLMRAGRPITRGLVAAATLRRKKGAAAKV